VRNYRLLAPEVADGSAQDLIGLPPAGDLYLVSGGDQLAVGEDAHERRRQAADRLDQRGANVVHLPGGLTMSGHTQHRAWEHEDRTRHDDDHCEHQRRGPEP
jgi:hypothetical protein